MKGARDRRRRADHTASAQGPARIDHDRGSGKRAVDLKRSLRHNDVLKPGEILKRERACPDLGENTLGQPQAVCHKRVGARVDCRPVDADRNRPCGCE